ncbi:DNA methyltransferase [Salipiger mucosus]|uniref:site-specific DNA-methyltransferase (adenine-specific) n=1 Tax=Salipiger mucosus DSM 16094 TaxID=1123237 RepID=S9RJT4_9RHOB|nr:DNA methyltransferase [Salipiger mucosus]EPX78385.1 Type III restriction-modification system methylation subunit [Salipiger mucosus DSM 16094]
MKNAFYFGDNLHILREYIPDESIDLVYLDPPFNSNASYNLLFKSPDKSRWADSQITTFDDTWSWGDAAEEAFDDILATQGRAADVMSSLRLILGTNDMLAYLTMMTARLVELRRVLKPTGSLYLHCDPTASHYLKIILDGVFGISWYRAEIVWKRTNARGTPKNWPHLHDTIFHYSGPKSRHEIPRVKANKAKLPHTLITGQDGKKYQTYELTGAGVTAEGDSGKPWRGFDVTAMGRHWGNSHEVMDQWADEGLIHFPSNGGFPRRKDNVPFDPESRKVTVGDVWTDIDRLNQTARERMGYPTQKPTALLNRIIEASSNEGNIVLDPFCGCGTTLHSAQALGRKWIGIDVAVQAMHVIQDRLKHYFPNIRYDVFGIPKSIDGALWLAENDPFKFEEWAVTALGAMHSGKFRGDGGIDGTFYYLTAGDDRSRGIVSVKGGRSLNPGMVRDLGGTLDTQRRLTRDDKAVGVLVCAHEPTRGMRDIARDFGKVDTLFGPIPAVQIITVKEMFEGVKINVPAMLDTVTAAAIGRKKATNAAFKKPQDLTQPAFMLPIQGGRSTREIEQVSDAVPVMPSFRQRRAVG